VCFARVTYSSWTPIVAFPKFTCSLSQEAWEIPKFLDLPLIVNNRRQCIIWESIWNVNLHDSSRRKLSEGKGHVDLKTGDSRYTRFRYPRFYFSIMRSIDILSATTVEASAQTHWVARAVPLTRPTILTPLTTNWGLSWRITQKIHRHVIRFPFYAFSIYAAIRKNATLAYNESHLCLYMR
jgi:hypothetical protein